MYSTVPKWRGEGQIPFVDKNKFDSLVALLQKFDL